MKEKDLFKQIINEKVADKEIIRSRAISNGTGYKGARFMKKRALVLSVVIIAVAVLLSLSVFTNPNVDDVTPIRVNAYEKLVSVIDNYNAMQNSFNTNQFLGVLERETAINEAVPMAPNAESDTTNSNSYSTTNVQTTGVDEGDIVKNDGRYIYKISTAGCIIIDTSNGVMSIASKIEIDNYVPQELYINGNQLIMIGGIYDEYYYNGSYGVAPMCDCMCYISYNNTDIRIYDISSKTEPVLERQITVEGNLYTSRIIEETNELLYIVNYYFSYGDVDHYIPELSDTTINSGEEAPMPVENIYYYEDIANYSYMVMGKINLANPEGDSEISAFLGLNGTIYVSTDNIYVATYDYQSVYKTNIWGWVSYDSTSTPKTRLVRISLDDLLQKASSRIDGTVKDRYSMDEYQGYLRVATSTWSQSSNVFVLKSDLTIAGQINNIAPGEAIYSVRFNGTHGSLVTFEQIDPYFNLDLSDPYNPTISAGLKEDGVSYYIHYIEGTDYTVGVGRNTEVVKTPYGDRVEWKQIKVTLYDNSSGEAENINTVYIPLTDDEWSCYSELFYNPKALLYNPDNGLFAFSYEGWSYNDYYYYSSMIQGLAVFKIDTDATSDAEKLIYKGTLSNFTDNGIDINSNWNYYYNSYFSFINRGVQIGNYIYTISDKVIVSYDIDTMIEVDRVSIYE